MVLHESFYILHASLSSEIRRRKMKMTSCLQDWESTVSTKQKERFHFILFYLAFLPFPKMREPYKAGVPLESGESIGLGLRWVILHGGGHWFLNLR